MAITAKILFFALFSASILYAEVWVKKYALAAGMDFAFSKGRFDGVSERHSSEQSLNEETVILPKVPFFFVYAFDARALANASSIALAIGLGYPEYEHVLQSGTARYLRFGIEYQYHFLWPSSFRIGTGIGYAFSSMRFPKAALASEAKTWSYANFVGNGANAVLSLNYYFNENLAAECAGRYRLLHLDRVSTDANDVSRLGSAVLQNDGELGLRLMFVF